ncbi:unnamed protein product [Dibothriocephalus latus]|uniref:Uncharacterized protein n=1 Tax=Dibothriocephalus latus TaxID=60516 RepID=A0A3P7P9S7_DIBLA|nr:unnamed protein product [Dibothriocephalus latus]
MSSKYAEASFSSALISSGFCKTQPCMPVIMSSVRLPVRHYEAWTERVYDVQEFDVTPQTLPAICKPDCPINQPHGACR